MYLWHTGHIHAVGIHFTARKDPIILGNETKEYPDNWGVAGGGESRQCLFEISTTIPFAAWVQV